METMEFIKKYLVLFFLLLAGTCNAQYIDYNFNASWANEALVGGYDYSVTVDVNPSSAIQNITKTPSNNNRSIKVSIEWKPAYVGTVVITAYFGSEAQCCGVSVGCPASVCRHESPSTTVQLGCPAFFQISTTSPSEHTVPYTASLSAGASYPSAVYQWYEKKPGDSDFVPVVMSTPGCCNVYNPTLTAVGNYQYYFVSYSINCGGKTSNTITIKGLPSCAYNTQNVSISPTLSAVGASGAFKIEKGNAYTLNISGVTDFDQHYTITHDGNSDITYNTSNRSFVLNADVGSYTFTIAKKEDGVDRGVCPNFQAINLWAIGDQETVIKSKCLVVLPEQICKSFNLKCSDPVDPATDYILQHFTYSVTSTKGIVVKPGVRLQAGAHLQLNVIDGVENPLDNKINYTSTTTFDDNGKVMGQMRSYFDQMGRNNQVQVKSLSDGVIMATATLYDAQGRAAITTLPAPVVGLPTIASSGCDTDPVMAAYDMHFKYKDAFVQQSSGLAYTYQSFDDYKDVGGSVVSNELNPSPVDNTTVGTLGWYYSTNNKNTDLDADAGEDRFTETGVPVTGYPYSRTLYYNDGTGSVKANTLPGDAFKAQNNGKYTIQETRTVADNDVVVSTYLNLRSTKVCPSCTTPANLKGNAYISYNKDMAGLESFTYMTTDGKILISLLKKGGTELQRSYNFYDDMGRILCTISPNGEEKLTEGISFDLIDKSTFRYDYKGLLIESNSTDKGISQFMYRRDGVLRFSQNAQQALNGTFSYVNYDGNDRPFETGLFTPSAGSLYSFGSASLQEAAEINGNNEYLSLASGGTKSEFVITHYDLPDASGPLTDAQATEGMVSWTESSAGAKTWYNYDERGRIITIVRNIPDLGQKKLTYEYAANGQVHVVAYQPDITAESFYHIFTYDDDSRLKNVYAMNSKPQTYKDNGAPATGLPEVQYEYYKHGPLKRVIYGDNKQEVNYTYTAQGWLKAINDPSNIGTDIFAEQLEYFSGDYASNDTPSQLSAFSGTGTDRFDGLPKAMVWFTQRPDGALQPSDPIAYKYSYDNLYRLTDGVYGNVTSNQFAASALGSYSETEISYDRNGNLQKLKRTGSGSTIVDDFSAEGSLEYAYNADDPQYNNRLLGALGYAEYSYNAIGQMITHKLLKPVIPVNRTYNYNNRGLTDLVAEEGKPLVKYVYDEGGKMVSKETYDKTLHTLQYTEYYVRDATGNVVAIYKKVGNNITFTELPVYGMNRLGSKYIINGVEQTIYELKDHLGSTRARFDKTTKYKESFADYYPYGLVHEHYDGSIAARNGYQGQYSTINNETGLNEFELRQYDPVIGRWTSMDPYGQYPSPYVGMGNNPVNSIDKDGGKRSPIFDELTGEFLGNDSEGFMGKLLFMSRYLYNQLSDNNQKVINHKTAVQNSYGVEEANSFVLANAIKYVALKTNIFPYTFDGLKNIGAWDYDNKIGDIFINGGVRPNKRSTGAFNEKNNITFNIWNHRATFRTVENIQNTFYHEYVGHGILGLGMIPSEHLQIYLMQQKHSSYKNTTPDFKQNAVEYGIETNQIKR